MTDGSMHAAAQDIHQDSPCFAAHVITQKVDEKSPHGGRPAPSEKSVTTKDPVQAYRIFGTDQITRSEENPRTRDNWTSSGISCRYNLRGDKNAF